MQFAPDLYYLDEETSKHKLLPGKGKYVVFLVFFMERILLLAGLLINSIVPCIPDDVINRTERHNYLQLEEAKKMRHKKVKNVFHRPLAMKLKKTTVEDDEKDN